MGSWMDFNMEFHPNDQYEDPNRGWSIRAWKEVFRSDDLVIKVRVFEPESPPGRKSALIWWLKKES